MEKLATGVIELLGTDAKGMHLTKSYYLGKPVMEGGEVYNVSQIRITDDFSMFHADITLEGFGNIWITQIKSIKFKDAERRTLQTQDGRDSENKNGLSQQQGFN